MSCETPQVLYALKHSLLADPHRVGEGELPLKHTNRTGSCAYGDDGHSSGCRRAMRHNPWWIILPSLYLLGESVKVVAAYI